MMSGGMLRDGFYVVERSDMVPFVPRSARSVLDIGSGSGAFGIPLRRQRPDVSVVVGVEADDRAVRQTPPGVYDELLVGFFPEVRPARVFDCIAFNDVLEHMVDPWRALSQTHDLLADGGTVIASLPNMRHWPVLRDLVLRGRWDYADEGVLDKTHLRWFTRATMADLFESTGFEVDRIEPLHTIRPGRTLRMIARVNRDFASDVAAVQYAVVARR